VGKAPRHVPVCHRVPSHPPCPPARATPSSLSSLAFPLAAAQTWFYARGKRMGWEVRSPRPVPPSQPRGSDWERGSHRSLLPLSDGGPSSAAGGMLCEMLLWLPGWMLWVQALLHRSGAAGWGSGHVSAARTGHQIIRTQPLLPPQPPQKLLNWVGKTLEKGEVLSKDLV